jgi:zinc protease
MKRWIILSLSACIGFVVPACQSKHPDQPTAPAVSVGTTPATPAAPAPDSAATPPGTAAVPDASTPGASAPGSEMMQDKSQMVGYGAEISRVVDRKDEIISVLRNGMMVIVKRVPSPVVAVRGYCFTGGVYEGKWLGGGLSHLLEHLVAGGSSQRRTEAQNRDLLQKIGNNSNAYTSEDHTAFFVNTTTEHMDQAVDLVTGWMLGALITPAEYRREYQVVQRELEMGKGQPDRQFYYLSATNRYKVSPARIPVIGYQEVIQGLSRDDVYSYYKLAYQPNNMLFAVAGDMDPEEMLLAVRKYVSDAKPGRVFSHDIAPEPRVMTPRTAVATFPKLGQAKLQLGFPSVRLDDPDLYALDLLASVVGGDESSAMVREIRDDKQLATSISVNDETPAYVTGTFTVDIELDPEKVQAATDAVLTMLDDVKKNGVDAGALARGKTSMRSALVKRLQTSEEIAASLAEDYITTGDAHFSDVYVKRIEAVTIADVKHVAAKYFDRSRLLTTVMLPAEYAGSQGLPRAVDLIRPLGSAEAAATQPTTQPVAATPASQVARTQLDNGTILLTKRITTSPLVVIQMYTLGGVTAEDAKTNGLGNLTMQMLPRGTTTRSADDISNFFASTGGEIATSCGNNTWSWSATCLKTDLDKTLEVYADVVTNPAFADKEVDLMKHRIEAGIAGQDADWSEQAIRFFKQKYFGPLNSPYQFIALGSAENVAGFTAAQLHDWYTNKILGGQRVLAIYGDIDPDKARELAGQYLGRGNKLSAAAATAGGRTPPPPAAQPSVPTVDVSEVAVQKTDQELAGIVIGFRSNAVIGSDELYPLTVGQTIAGGYSYPTGYLFETLRGRGLVYDVEAVNNPGRSREIPGTFFVFAGCAPSKVNEVVETCLENIAREQGTAADINPTWFNRSKELITLADALDHETPASQATTAALDELFGLGYDFHGQFADRIKGVSLPDVQQIARQRLNSCVVTISTPAPQLVDVRKGPRPYSSFPAVELTPRGIQHDTGGAAR